MGWVWSKTPLTVPNWEVEFEFKVGGESRSLHGDGFAFWATEDRAKPGPVFGNQDFSKGLGIIFDTYPNGRHAHSFPYVMAMVGDGKTSYDHANDGEQNEIAGCEADIRNKGFPTKARVKHYKDNYLELSLQYKAWDQWDKCFSINVTLPSAPYIGFTALTGEVHDSHDLVSIAANSISPVAKIAASTSSSNTQSHAASSSSSWGFFGWLLRIVGLVTFAGVGFFVFRVYQNDHKRF